MNNDLYNMIFKRKSFHLFRNIGNEHITDIELDEIKNEFNNFVPLVEDIRVKMKIVKNLQNYDRGQEYSILFYSEKKDNYLQNIGYIGEQIEEYNNSIFWSFDLGKYRKANWWVKTASTSIKDKITIRTANTMRKLLEIGKDKVLMIYE